MPRPGRPPLPRAAVRALLGCLLLGSAGALALPGAPAGKTCALAGTWVNEAGSRMTISAADSAGRFSGSFLTAVTSSDQPVGRSSLSGVQHRPGRRAQPTFGFVVKWDDAGSVAVFAGQCFVDGGGQESLETSWLLRREAAAQAEDWRATLVGRNVFVRLQ